MSHDYILENFSVPIQLVTPSQNEGHGRQVKFHLFKYKSILVKKKIIKI